MIRLAKKKDLDQIMEIIKKAKQYMVDSGNKDQWSGNYPSREVFEQDLQKERLYVCEDHEKIYGVFVFSIGEEPSYVQIENGQWLNEDPYGTIHRIASDGETKGVFKECFSFCKKKIENIKIDTHEDNLTMQHVIEKNGFQKCGIVYVRDHAKRIAYQYKEERETFWSL